MEAKNIIVTSQHVCRRFADLPDEDKQRVLDNHRYYNVDFEWWDDILDSFKEGMADHGIDVDLSKTYFSGFYSQGNGASFTGYLFTFEDWLEKHVPPMLAVESRLILDALNNDDIDLCASIENASSHGYFQRAEMHIDGFADEVSDEEQELLVAACDELSQWLDEFCKDKAKELYRTLEKEYEALTSDECIAETFATGCVFEVGTGRFFYYEGE